MQKKSDLLNLPEAVVGERADTDSVFLRTVLRKDVHERLKEFAQHYATGQGHWDFGVAVQILLDCYDESKLALQDEKLDLILSALSKEEEPQEKEEEFVEMLGGSKIPKKE